MNGVADAAISNGQSQLPESRSAPAPEQQILTSGAFQAINRQTIGQQYSNAASRNSDARVSPQVDPATAEKSAQPAQAPSAETPPTNGSKAQLESLDAGGSYGTRSRRTGNQRLNYAEDQDMDFEFTSAATTASLKKSAVAAASSATTLQGTHTAEPKRAKESANPIAVNGGVAHSNANNVAKEAAGGSSSTTTNPKKRKAAGAPSTSTPPAASASVGTTNMRKTAGVSAPSVLARETNMMTFVKSKAYLNKKGELAADDGIKLAVNGTCMMPRIPF